jgi:sulfur carrier protein
MEITVNGDKKTLPDDELPITDILKKFDVENPELVTVQLNDTFVPKIGFDLTKVRNGDRLDFLYFMGGGRL